MIYIIFGRYNLDLDKTMKPTVPETVRVIKLETNCAVVMLEGGKPCKGCGAAKIWLCRTGNGSMFLTVKNAAQAKRGD